VIEEAVPKRSADAVSTGRLRDPSAVRSLHFGDTVATYVVDGVMALRTADFFPAVPADYWSAHRELLDDDGRVVMSAGGLLIERGGRALLIDAGLGPSVGRTRYGPVNCGAMLDVLRSLARRADDVDTVAFTHLHGDHVGWAFTADPDGQYTKTFPNARYLVAASEWAPRATGPASPPQEIIDRLTMSGPTLIDDGEPIFPGVRALVTPGHSPGHTTYVVTSTSGTRLVAFGDAFHVPAQLAHHDWGSAPDTDSAAVLTARRRLLDELTQPDTFGFAVHFGDQAFGRVMTDEAGAPHWEPVPTRVQAPTPLTLA
jgi:glyoxylase-like metal-dependent hydrolase (beta-lactamase superfamily II)